MRNQYIAEGESAQEKYVNTPIFPRTFYCSGTEGLGNQGSTDIFSVSEAICLLWEELTGSWPGFA